MRALVLLAVGAAVLAVPSPALAGSERMSLTCSESGLVVERSNGASWWGSDGSVWTTRDLQVEGGYAKSYGHVASASVTCTGDHLGTRWTVELVRAR